MKVSIKVIKTESPYFSVINQLFPTILTRDLEGRTMGIAANSSVLTQLSFVIKNLKNSRCANPLANRNSYLLFILSQSKAGK